MDLSYRVILYHNTAASARLRFLRFPYHSVFAFKPLPKLAMLLDDHVKQKISVHPAQVIAEAEKQLGLKEGELKAEAEFRHSVDVAGGPVDIILARFTCIDAPMHIAEQQQGCFIDLTQARDLPQVELELLRKVYELIIGD